MEVWHAIVEGLGMVLAWPALGYMLLGIVIGFAVGILPGLGGGVTLALMLPFTYAMEPVSAFAFLLGMASVTATTGDITSILFGVPGEVSSAALVTDGHPLAKQGEAGRALGAALMSSMMGAVVGAIVLAATIPIIRPAVLSLASPEFFMLALLGIAFVASVSRGAVVKGLIAAGIGLLLATVGLDPQQGTQRFTFGQLFLWDGVGLVPVALGLFAIPEIVDLGRKGTSIAGQALGSSSGVLQGVRDVFRHIGLTIRCSMIGTLLGAIPGLGGSVGQWIAYGHAYHTSKNKELFGKGAIEGVIGPGAANNSKEAGNLVPIIAFGIPTGLSAAILLGAFLIHGLQPGPKMLTEQLPITMSFVWVMVISNIVAVSVCLLFLKQIALLTFIRAGIILPIIILLVLIGVFSENNSLLDFWVLIVAGAFGIAMVELHWPRAPLILGMVLGRLLEIYFFKSFNLYGFTWLSRPIVMVLGIIGLLVLLFPLAQPMIARRIARRAGGPLRNVDVFESDDA